MKDKRFTVEKNDKYIAILDEGKSIGNTYHVCALLNKQHEIIEQLKKELFESRCEYIYDTADISDKPYIDEKIEEIKKNIFEKGVYGID